LTRPMPDILAAADTGQPTPRHGDDRDRVVPGAGGWRRALAGVQTSVTPASTAWPASSFARLTVDHSEVEELVTAGRITSEQARSHPLRNVVTRALGTDPAPVADLWVFSVLARRAVS